MHKRVMALLLSLVLLLSAAMPVTAMAAEEYAGSFVLVAMNANSTIVEPTRIQYKSGQTIQQALADSDIDFVGLENGFVYEINGVSANYLLYYDKGGYKLDAPASSVKALCFHVSSTYSDAAIQLIIQMADYLDMTNHVQNYPAAANAYATALKGLRTATADSAGPLLKNLKDAIAEYAALLDGTKYTVSATATQNGNAVEAPILSLTDVYGNVTTGTGSVQVIAGDYKFCVSDGGYNRTEGTLTVSADAQVSATLPYGEWFGNIRLLDADQEPYRAAQNRANHTAQYWIEDTANALSSVYLNVVMGNVPNTKTTRLRTIYTGTNGKDMSGTSRSWNSTATSLTYLLTSGMEGKTFALEAQYTGSDGYTQIQSYDVTVTRVPTLKALAATAEGTKLPLKFAPNTREYSLKTVSSTVDIDAAPFGEDYTVTGTGAVQLTGDTPGSQDSGSSAQRGAEHLYPPHSEGSFRTGDAGCAFRNNGAGDQWSRLRDCPGGRDLSPGPRRELYLHRHEEHLVSYADHLHGLQRTECVRPGACHHRLADRSGILQRHLCFQPDRLRRRQDLHGGRPHLQLYGVRLQQLRCHAGHGNRNRDGAVSDPKHRAGDS